jgi:hypothetical protein
VVFHVRGSLGYLNLGQQGASARHLRPREVVELPVGQHLVTAQPDGAKMLNSYFSTPIVL